MRILALDWGTVRIGAAISDPSGKIAFPLDDFIESKEAIAEIKKIVDDLQIEKIIIGRPKNLSGEDSKSTQAVEKFVGKLSEQIACSFEYIDERFSSVGAKKILTEQGLNQKQQKELVDNTVAQQMLQMYLDSKNKN